MPGSPAIPRPVDAGGCDVQNGPFAGCQEFRVTGVFKARRAIFLQTPGLPLFPKNALPANLFGWPVGVVASKDTQQIAVRKFRAVPFIPGSGLALRSGKNDTLRIPGFTLILGE